MLILWKPATDYGVKRATIYGANDDTNYGLNEASGYGMIGTTGLVDIAVVVVSWGNVGIPKGFPRDVERVGSRFYGFPCFPYPVISTALPHSKNFVVPMTRCFWGIPGTADVIYTSYPRERTTSLSSAMASGQKPGR